LAFAQRHHEGNLDLSSAIRIKQGLSKHSTIRIQFPPASMERFAKVNTSERFITTQLPRIVDPWMLYSGRCKQTRRRIWSLKHAAEMKQTSTVPVSGFPPSQRCSPRTSSTTSLTPGTTRIAPIRPTVQHVAGLKKNRSSISTCSPAHENCPCC